MRLIMRSLFPVVLSLLNIVSLYSVGSRQSQQDSIRINRLISTCKLWGEVKYFHPYMAYRDDIDWDKALITAIPKINAATTSAGFADAVQSMLDVLDDQATRILRESSVHRSTVDNTHPSFQFTQDSILIININHYADLEDYDGAKQRMDAVVKEFPKARGVLFDLRSAVPVHEGARGYLTYIFEESKVGSMLSSTPISLPSERTRMHTGFVPQQGMSTGGYSSGFQTTDGRKISPAQNVKEMPIVFLVNAHSEIPLAALALQSAGKGAIVAEGRASDASVVTTFRALLSDSVRVEMRLGELVYEDGPGGLQTNVTIPVSSGLGESNLAFVAALSLARNFKQVPLTKKFFPSRAIPVPDKPYTDMNYPSTEYRILALFRVWNVMNYFFPYKDLMDESWENVLQEFIPKLENCANALEYNLAIAEMVTHINDSHGRSQSPVLREYFGSAPPPFLVRVIEGVPVITRILNEEATGQSGVRVGDVILKLDGEEAADRIARYAKYIPASTPQRKLFNAASRMLNGPEGSIVKITIRNRENQEQEITLSRKSEYSRNSTQRTGDIFKMLPGNIGYADLDRLSVPMVDEMFEKFRNAKAIIFDMRGYPKGTAWEIAPRLTQKSSVAGALFQPPLVMAPDGPIGDLMDRSVAYTFRQSIPQTDKWRYKGKTVMLIDERTMSQAEHTGLFFEAANGTKFIGSNTAGANGDVTNFMIPGGIVIYFTGQSVRHADGRQLQRIGLVPDIEVKPSIKGIQDGKDEVLEKAIKYLEE